MQDKTVVLTGEGIIAFHLMSQYHAIKLEGKGLKHSSGRSVTAHVKKKYGFKGSRTAVLDQMAAKIKELHPTFEPSH